MNLVTKMLLLFSGLFLLYIVFKERIDNKLKDIKQARSGEGSQKDNIFKDIPIISENKFNFDSNLFVTMDIQNEFDVQQEEVLGYEDLLRLHTDIRFHDIYVDSLSKSLESKYTYYGELIKITPAVIDVNQNDIASRLSCNNEIISNSKDILKIITKLKVAINKGHFNIEERLIVCINY